MQLSDSISIESCAVKWFRPIFVFLENYSEMNNRTSSTDVHRANRFSQDLDGPVDGLKHEPRRWMRARERHFAISRSLARFLAPRRCFPPFVRRICLRMPANKWSTLWLRTADTSVNLASNSRAANFPSETMRTSTVIDENNSDRYDRIMHCASSLIK